MPDKFDRYREALVVETSTLWQAEHENLNPAEKAEFERKLHADPSACAHLEYIRLATGFCRRITVTPADVTRLTS